MNITEFLEARMSEDEAAARAAADSTRGGRWSAQQLDHEGLSVYGDDPAGQIDFDSVDALPTLKYLVRFDPARVLAECAAKRAIIEQCEVASADRDSLVVDYYVRAEDIEAGYATDPGKLILQSLASVYKDHPDYDPDWAAGHG